MSYEASVNQPFTGPAKITIFFDWLNGGVEAALASDGITTEVTRYLPNADARRRLARHLTEAANQRLQERLRALPARLDALADLASFAQIYAGLVEERHRRPLAMIGKATGLSRNTLNARLQRARAEGLLTPPDEHGLSQITGKALDAIKKAEELKRELIHDKHEHDAWLDETDPGNEYDDSGEE